MGNIHADIKPSGLSQKDEVDLLTALVRSIYGVCAKLDDDAGVPLETYEANCCTAIFTGVLTDSKGNRTGRAGDYIISPGGISDAARLQCVYEIIYSIYTLATQLVADALTLNNYVTGAYTAKILYLVENSKGSTTGNGTSYRFRPGGIFNMREYVNLLYQIVDAWKTLVGKLDDDGTVTDANYEALWYTATVLLIIEDSAGNTIGNANPWLG